MNTLLLLGFEFFKTGLFAIGGGMATLPFLTQMAGNHPHWFTTEMLADMLAVAESTPGPIGVNMATYAGFNAYGALGCLVATLSLVLPSYLVIVVIARFLEKYNNNPLVQSAFLGLRPAVAGLIASAGLSVLQFALLTQGVEITSFGTLLQALDWRKLVLFAVFFFGTQWNKTKKLHPILYIAIAAVIGIVFQF